jgi:hypothetical protein
MKARAFGILTAMVLLVTSPTAQLPPISWTCPMHPDVLEEKKSTCAICGMDLESVRLVTMYTCPLHAVIEQAKPGKCRICSRDLVPLTAALTFTCAADRDVNQLEPGKCADGSAMVPRYTKRAHGDHNPKHGGIFFMAPDNWHHLEGTYPAVGRFRVYVYDDYSKPLSVAEARKIRGRVVTREAFDAKTGTTRELAAAPLVLGPNGAFFEARIERLPVPAKLTAKITFRPDAKESRFDFMFPAHSKEPPASGPRPDALASPIDRAQGAPTARRGVADESATPAPDLLLGDLKARREEVESLLKSGALGGIYLPALQAKDLALQIQSQYAAAAIEQEMLETRVREIVLAAYQLDNYGDLGDAVSVQEAYRRFDMAISQLESLVSGGRR